MPENLGACVRCGGPAVHPFHVASCDPCHTYVAAALATLAPRELTEVAGLSPRRRELLSRCLEIAAQLQEAAIPLASPDYQDDAIPRLMENVERLSGFVASLGARLPTLLN